MNSYEKATLLAALTALPLVLLFMHGMDYRSTAIVGVIGAGVTIALLFALRERRTRFAKSAKAHSQTQRDADPRALSAGRRHAARYAVRAPSRAAAL